MQAGLDSLDDAKTLLESTSRLVAWFMGEVYVETHGRLSLIFLKSLLMRWIQSEYFYEGIVEYGSIHMW